MFNRTMPKWAEVLICLVFMVGELSMLLAIVSIPVGVIWGYVSYRAEVAKLDKIEAEILEARLQALEARQAINARYTAAN